MTPPVDWLLEEAVEIHPNVWRAESPLPATSTWPIAYRHRADPRADSRGPRLVLTELERADPRALCFYPSQLGWVNQTTDTPPDPETDPGAQVVVASMMNLACESPASTIWEMVAFEPLPASHLVLAIEDYPHFSMTPEIADVLLAISRGEGNDAPATSLDLGMNDYMIEEGASDPELLAMIRDDQLYRLFEAMDRFKEPIAIEEIVEMVGVKGPADIHAARKRGEERRRLEGLLPSS